MKGKKFLAFSLAAALLVGGAMSVSAAGVQDIFDANTYAKYADLKAAYGNDVNALLQHFLANGAKEGRVMSPILDVVAYRNAYPDLNAAFGDNWDAYVDHYLTCGIKEKRMSGVNFDLIDYAEKNPDVKAAFGEDYAAIAHHYLECGIAEGRKGGQIVKEAPVTVVVAASGSSSSTTKPADPQPSAPETTAHYHTWTDKNGNTAIVDHLDPNCTKTGYNVYRCTEMVSVKDGNGNTQLVRCSATKKEELPIFHVKPLNANDINTICATCTQEGEEHYTCRLCGLHVDTVIPKLAHTWAATGKYQASTCTVKGWDEYKCSVCGTTKQEARPLVPHDIGRWNTVREADCQTTGLKKAACATCYQVFEDVIPRTDHKVADIKTVTVYTDAFADNQLPEHTIQEVEYCDKCKIITDVDYQGTEACAGANDLCAKCHHDINRKYSSATKIYHVGEYFRTDVQ